MVYTHGTQRNERMRSARAGHSFSASLTTSDHNSSTTQQHKTIRCDMCSPLFSSLSPHLTSPHLPHHCCGAYHSPHPSLHSPHPIIPTIAVSRFAYVQYSSHPLSPYSQLLLTPHSYTLHSFTHSLTPSPSHSLTHSLTHSLPPSLTHSLAQGSVGGRNGRSADSAARRGVPHVRPLRRLRGRPPARCPSPPSPPLPLSPPHAPHRP